MGFPCGPDRRRGGAAKQIELARDAGVNLFDTADVYSSGLSEEILGKALGSDRDEVLIATKVRMPMGEGPNDAGLSRHHVIRARRTACVALAPITSTFTRCTSGMARLRSRRRCTPSTTSYSPARCATSAARTTPPGR